MRAFKELRELFWFQFTSMFMAFYSVRVLFKKEENITAYKKSTKVSCKLDSEVTEDNILLSQLHLKMFRRFSLVS